MNFLPARVRDTGELVVGEQVLPGLPELATYNDREVLVGIRAENIDVAGSAADGAVRATVEVVEPTGAAVLLTVRLGGQSGAGHQLKVQAPAGFQAEPEGTVWLDLQPAALRCTTRRPAWPSGQAAVQPLPCNDSTLNRDSLDKREASS